MKLLKNEGFDPFGVFFTGNPDQKFERLVDFVEKNQEAVHSIHLGHGFAVRTSNMQVRIGMTVFDGEEEDFPYRFCFENLSHDDNAALELQHGTSGYVWINGGQELCHMTGTHHGFTFRTTEQETVATFSLMPLQHDEM